MDAAERGPELQSAVPRAATTSPGRRRPTPRRASAPGVGLAFDAAAGALSAQMSDVNALNTRLGGALAATLALAGIAVVAREAAWMRIPAAVALVLALALSAWASRASRWSAAPDPAWLAQFAGDEPDFMKEVALPGVLRALERNRDQIRTKSLWLNWAFAWLALSGVLLVVGRILAG
ncbi:MAG: hypothetical protein ACREOA_07275 [Candidatus Dormibacteria bacterium]